MGEHLTKVQLLIDAGFRDEAEAYARKHTDELADEIKEHMDQIVNFYTLLTEEWGNERTTD